MKKYFHLSLMMCLAIIGFTSCSDNDNDNSSTSTPMTMSEVKSAVAASEATFSSQFNVENFSAGFSLLQYFNATYGKYTRESDASVIPLANLLNVVNAVKSGDISGVPTLLATISNVAGTYRADTVNKRWVAVADTSSQNRAPGDSAIITPAPANKQLHLIFYDSTGKECVANMAWKAELDHNDSITISTTSQTIKVLLPNNVNVSLVQNNADVLTGFVNFDYTANSKTVAGLIRVSDKQGYDLNAGLTLGENVISGIASLSYNGVNGIKANIKVNGTNFISHISNQANTLSVLGESVNIEMPNGINIIITVANPSALQAEIAPHINKDSYSNDDVNAIVSIFNKYITRILTVNDAAVAKFTFQARPNPTTNTPFGHLDTKVNFYNGESCMLYELFTGGERTTFVNVLSTLLTGYTTLVSSLK